MEQESKIIVDTILKTARDSYRDGYARGREHTLEEAARIILKAAKAQHRHIAAYLSDAVVAAIKLPPPTLEPIPEADPVT